ncbi:uncharacterized protein BX663DRAFT_580587, partial [Cokeromyces recurvatus]|uniref:uncharacterized protein n=1 Tax=Cokeromyces recurvatus TaxID=90255 RepID=UPI0022201A48
MSASQEKDNSISIQDSTGAAFNDKNEDDILMKDSSNSNIQDDSGSNEDAIEHLRETLRKLSQELARGVANNIAPEKLAALQDEANRITGCIKFLDEVQIYCSPKPFIPSSTQITPSPRDSHLIPTDLPFWQWQGNVWKKDSDIQGSVEDLLDTFALVVDSNGLSLDHSWGRLMPIRMNRDQRSWFNETLKGRSLTWKE